MSETIKTYFEEKQAIWDKGVSQRRQRAQIIIIIQ
jgi:hypothetical protein